MSQPEPKNTLVVPGAPGLGSKILASTKTFMQQHWKTLAMAVVGVTVLIVIAILFQKHFKNKFMQKAGVEDEDDDGEKTCEFIYFYTTWCPYCKQTMPVWQEFASQWNGKTKNGYMIITSELDCDQNEAVANKYNVQGYPTIKCIMNGKVTDFDAKPTVDTLNQFLHACFE